MARKKLSVMRLINCKACTVEENIRVRDKAVDYVLRPEARRKGLIHLNGINPMDIKGSFGYFAKASSKDDGRPLKHIVLSFGEDKLPWEKYLDVTKQVANYYGKSYQTIAVVHDNIPNRPHAHILIDTFNVSTEKKLSEGPQDFRKLVDYIDEILEQNGIPKLLQGKISQKVVKSDYVSEASNVPALKQIHIVEPCGRENTYGFDYETYRPIEALHIEVPNGFEFMQNWTIRDFQGAHRFFYPELYKK